MDKPRRFNHNSSTNMDATLGMYALVLSSVRGIPTERSLEVVRRAWDYERYERPYSMGIGAKVE